MSEMEKQSQKMNNFKFDLQIKIIWSTLFNNWVNDVNAIIYSNVLNAIIFEYIGLMEWGLAISMELE